MVVRATHWRRAERSEDRMSLRSVPALATALLAILAISLAGPSVVLAGFTGKPVVAPGGELKAATLAAPVGLAVGDGGCEFSNADTWV
jgi:hypothetical protein